MITQTPAQAGQGPVVTVSPPLGLVFPSVVQVDGLRERGARVTLDVVAGG